MKKYAFLSRADYFTALTTSANQATPGQRLFVAAMDFDPDEPMVAALFAALQRAARIGADVTVLVDAHNFLIDKRGILGPLFYRRSLDNAPGGFGAQFRALEALKEAGGTYCITNAPTRRFTTPIVGRSHIKGAVVANRVFVGGCNLERPGHIDVMATWEYKPSADQLANWFTKMAESANVRTAFGDVDADYTIDATARLLLDAGVPRQSIIYDEALRLIDEAQDWLLITCQYFPGGPTAKHLAAAQARGVNIEIDYSHPRTHGAAAPIHHLHQISQRARRLPRGFFAGKLNRQMPKLHAKILLSERAAMIGSHNYVIQGVNFGTAELALISTDPAFSSSLRTFVRQQLAAAALGQPASQQLAA